MNIGKTRGAVVLLYNVELNKEKELRILGMKCGIRVKKVPKEEYLRSLGWEAGIKSTPTSEEVYKGEELSTDIIVMRNFNQAMLNIMLAMCREIGGIHYTAVLTRTNAEWNIFQLLDELKREEEAIVRKQTTLTGTEAAEAASDAITSSSDVDNAGSYDVSGASAPEGNT